MSDSECIMSYIAEESFFTDADGVSIALYGNGRICHKLVHVKQDDIGECFGIEFKKLLQKHDLGSEITETERNEAESKMVILFRDVEDIKLIGCKLSSTTLECICSQSKNMKRIKNDPQHLPQQNLADHA